LDGLRGIAILLVICCHYEVFARQFWRLPAFGWVGVDLFFVLSGFLITSVLLNLRGQVGAYKQFYDRRIRRIFPPYFIFLVILYITTAMFGDYALYKKGAIFRNLLFMQSFGNPIDAIRLMMSGTTLSLAHSHLGPAMSGLRGPVSDGSGILWSLSIEEYYYLVWAPVILWMGARRAAIVGIVICLVELVTRWLGPMGTGPYFFIFYRFDAPMFGSFVALLMASKLSRRTVIATLVVAGLAGAATVVAVLLPMGNILGREIRQDHSFMIFGVPSLSLIAAMAVGISVMKSGSRFLFLLRLRGLRFLGKISYTLYLWHGFIYLCFLHFFPPNWTVSSAAILCTVALSWASWIYLERPILESGRTASREPQTELKRASATSLASTTI
jgi:peptidoglycan/LPS O-acetylase OafA/YrhL